mmetsp:Transcript_6105/g.6298  ORF Transcript_6105/g.6298 Transcript_6105/m.6298 type:complete len:473 (-) Transcript_6105:237-1655(-)|eukprot:CAMPEP_0182432208 /NCGR_PEP_ID=MMETSP1167-20130531/54806_1 /TAXON_ID=2988 /ORGANISM="Mallomonas Sp, Strain CCMP3275" /LENGTH=472 /DNA_ID=CAMNT_0024619433 /DNA_START=44 /DNA_END=1462 /DNA_ORIENTATION=+
MSSDNLSGQGGEHDHDSQLQDHVTDHLTRGSPYPIPPSFSRVRSNTTLNIGYLSKPYFKKKLKNSVRKISAFRRHSLTPKDLTKAMRDDITFDSSTVRDRLGTLWSLEANFGRESNPFDVYLDEIVSDRFALLNGMQVLRDELQMAFKEMDSGECHHGENVYVCHADLSLPSVVSTIAYTNCGDRVDIASNHVYESMVASRFASISELGDVKPERFNPTGGGTDDGKTFAYVTVQHQLDPPLRKRIYAGNPKSFILVNFDLKTHCGKYTVSENEIITDGPSTFTGIRCCYGRCRESVWREARSACGAIVGCIRGYDEMNAIHTRIRRDLGEDSFRFLQSNQILAKPDNIPVTFLVASAIVAIRGMINTAYALRDLLDERGVGSLTASVTVNSAASDSIGIPDNIVYLGRCTVFQQEIRLQSLGLDASKYTATMEDGNVIITYENVPSDALPVRIIQRDGTEELRPFDSHTVI